MFLGAFSKILWKKIGIKVLTFGGNIELTKLAASNLSTYFVFQLIFFYILQTCLSRWKEEVDQDVNNLNTAIKEIDSQIGNVYAFIMNDQFALNTSCFFLSKKKWSFLNMKNFMKTASN